MPKCNKKLRGKKIPFKRGSGCGTNKEKKKHVDPYAEIEMNTDIDVIVGELERTEESVEHPSQMPPKVQEKKQRKRRVAKIEGLTVKPGMTAAQACKMAHKLRQQQPLRNIPNQSFDDEEEKEDDAGGSGEDYSDTANERPTEYRKGGYHPVVVGEVYHDRYRIVKKLGWGYFSTVWLVWDYTDERYYAMKIQKSASHYTEAAYDEIKLLGDIMSADPDKTCCCARLNDYFEQTGPNGTHVCMVFDVYGEDLLSLIERYDYRGVPLPIVKCISRQILVGLGHVHSLEIIHTDLKPENVLLSTPKHAIISLMKRYIPPPLHQRPRLVERDPKCMTKSQRRRYYKKLKNIEKNVNSSENTSVNLSHDVTQTDNEDRNLQEGEQKLTEMVSESDTDLDWEVERLHHVVLADFGNSCWTCRQFTDDVQTRQYRSPEVILGEPYSTPIDLWSAACMIFELITGEFLFDPRKGDCYSRDEDHLALMTELLGELPESMRLGDGKYRSQYYTSRGELRNIKDLNFWSLEDVLHGKHKFTRKKAGEIAQFLLPMLEFDPQERATATEMLANFEHFFEIQDDDYAPFCFIPSETEHREGESESSSSNAKSNFSGDYDAEEEEDEEHSYHEDVKQLRHTTNKVSDENDIAEALRYWEEHPILNKESLQRRGLSVTDIQAVLSGRRLDNAAAQEAANDVIRLLSEETDDGSDDQIAYGEVDAVSSASDYNTSTGGARVD